MAVIGIPVRYDYDRDMNNRSIIYIFESLRRTIQKAGGDIKMILPIQDVDYMKTEYSDFPELTEEEKIKINNELDKCDGLLLPGGIKYSPFDMYILDYAIKNDMPTLGICLSMQMMTCYENNNNLELIESNINHNEPDKILSHLVKIDKESKLYKIIGKEEIMVNSIHKYHANESNIYKTVAYAPDGVIEAIEHPNLTFNIGLQWHPEKNYDEDENSRKIIDEFIKQAENRVI